MPASIELSDLLVRRLSEIGLTTPESIERLLTSALDYLQSEKPLINAYQTLFEQTHDAVFIIAPDGRNIAVNQRACELTGYTPEEYAHLSFVDTTRDPEASKETLGRLLAGEAIPPYERTFLKKSGGSFIAEVTVELIRDAAGKPQYIQSVVRDITQRKRDEERLRESERLLRQIIDLVPVQIFAKDADGRYILANRATAEDFGGSVEDIIGKTDDELWPDPANAIEFRKQDLQVLEENGLLVIPRSEYTDSQGRKRIMQTAKMLLKFPGYDKPAILGVSTDITEITNAAAELEKAYQQAYELAAERQHVQILTQFVQDSSHEFRTPLSVINTSIFLMARTDDAEKRNAHAAQATAQIKRITRLLEQLQIMANVDSGATFTFAPVDINHIIRVAVARVPKSGDRPLPTLDMVLDEALPSIEGDAKRLGQAVEHLLDNALRFTPASGSVTLTTRREDECVVVEIRDTGVGIAPDDLPNVTRRFWRQDSSHTTPGFGLGLPIAQKIAERHGGTLTIVSQQQVGTIVTVTLPLSA